MAASRKYSLFKFLLRSTLGQRLALYLMLICISFSLITITGVMLFQYQRDYHSYHEKTASSIEAIKEQLAHSLWRVDEESIQLLLVGTYRLSHISGLMLDDPIGGEFHFGELALDNNLVVNLQFEGEYVGRLTASVNHQGVIDGVVRYGKKIVITILIIFGLIGVTFTMLLNQVVTRHIRKICQITNSSDFASHKSYHPIILERDLIEDELTDLVNILNAAQKKNIDHAVARESYEYQLELQANYDALTNLPNRYHATDYFNRIAANVEPENKKVLAILFIDLDGFKEINDTLGHNLGDLILKQTASRFDDLAKLQGGYISRFGGDEFVAGIVCDSKAEAEDFAEKIIGVLRKNFIINNNNLRLSCSIGIVFSPPEPSDIDELIRKADIAMYNAKESGRNCFVAFDESMIESIVNLASIKNKLQKAIADNLLEIYYQPLIDLRARKIIGFEALLRWHDEELGFISPEVFIPVAEKAGMVFSLDSWVFSRAVEQVAKWRQLTGEDFIVSVNFSPGNFVDKALLNWLAADKIFQQKLDWVEVEVTERIMLDDEPLVMESLEKMLAFGISFSIDDFGTGYSSLGYIKKFNHVLSKIKIDRMFVSELIHDDAGQALVKSIVTMADSLSIEVLAEGVETLDQEQILIRLGCNFAQGFYYSRPQPAADIERLIVEANPLPAPSKVLPNVDISPTP